MRGLSNKARRLVRLYGDAREADYMKGCGDPDDIPETEEYLRRRTYELHRYIRYLEVESGEDMQRMVKRVAELEAAAKRRDEGGLAGYIRELKARIAELERSRTNPT